MSTLFKQEKKITFSDFLLQVRMQKAMELLRNQDMKCYEVADMVGYNTPEYFIEPSGQTLLRSAYPELWQYCLSGIFLADIPICKKSCCMYSSFILSRYFAPALFYQNYFIAVICYLLSGRIYFSNSLNAASTLPVSSNDPA